MIQCAALDCEGSDGDGIDNCPLPIGCFTGTFELDFNDKLILCPNIDKCAPSLDDCLSEVNLEERLICSGNGILRYKDYNSQPYCECGDKIAGVGNSTVTQITQLTKNGYGGAFCNEYYANDQIIIFSLYDYKNDKPYRSTQTGEVLPGKFIGYNGTFYI